MTGKEIKEKRQALGLSQKELASLIGVGKNTIYNYENGGKIPDSKLSILEYALNPNIGSTKTEVKEDQPPERFEEVVAVKVLEHFGPTIKNILDSHQQSKDALNRLSILTSMLMDKVEELEEKISDMEHIEKAIFEKVNKDD